jgi:hypothetical protein
MKKNISNDTLEKVDTKLLSELLKATKDLIKELKSKK